MPTPRQDLALKTALTAARVAALWSAFGLSCAAAALALCSPRPAAAEAWAPDTPDDVVALVACHALGEAEIDRETRALSGPGWSLRHQALFERIALQEEAERRLAAAVDRDTRAALLATYFPEGVEAGEAEARVARRARCRALYATLAAEMSRRTPGEMAASGSAR